MNAAIPAQPSMPCLVTYDTDVSFFGAKGNDSADDTAAFQAAIAALGTAGGTILVRRGIYRITADILINQPNIKFVGTGWGSIIKKSATNINVFRITAAGCGIGNLMIDGDTLAQGSLILIESATNHIYNCFLTRNGLMADGAYVNQSHGICLNGSSSGNRNLIEGNWLTSIHDVGIAQNNSRDNKVINNDLSTIGFEGITVDDQAHRCLVRGNRMVSSCQRGGAAAISIDRTDLSVIAENIIASTGQVGQPGTGIKTNNNLGASNQNNIIGNIIVDPTALASAPIGIHLFNGTGGAASNNNVANNIIRGYTAAAITITANCNNNKITGNTLNGNPLTNNGTGNTITASS